MRLVASLVPLACAATACGVDIHTGVSYDDRHGAAVMDVYVPEDAEAAPAVMLVHGGSWRGGSRVNFAEAALRLARSGWVAATIDYRLVPDGAYLAAPQDVFCALAFLRAHAAEYRLDPARIAVMGYSAGGHLVSLLGLAADTPALQDDGCPAGRTGAPAAVINGAGPSDLRAMADAPAVREFVGAPLAEDPARWDLLSPITHVAPGAPPFLVIHSEGDLVVDVAQSRAFRDALAAAGVPVRLLALPGGGHLLNEGADLGHEVLGVSLETPEAFIAVADFLERTVGAP